MPHLLAFYAEDELETIDEKVGNSYPEIQTISADYWRSRDLSRTLMHRK